MQHRGEDGVGQVVSGNIQKNDSSHFPARLEVFHNVGQPLRLRALDSRLQIVTFLKIDIDDMVAASGSAERQGLAIDIDSLERRDICGRWFDAICNILEIFQLFAYHTGRINHHLRSHAISFAMSMPFRNCSRKAGKKKTCLAHFFESVQKCRIASRTQTTLSYRPFWKNTARATIRPSIRLMCGSSRQSADFADARQARWRITGRWTMDLRTQMGWVSRAGFSRRRRDPYPEPR